MHADVADWHRSGARSSRLVRSLSLVGLVFLLVGATVSTAAASERPASDNTASAGNPGSSAPSGPANSTHTGAGAWGGTAWPQWASRDACDDDAFHPSAQGSLVDTTSAGPNGSVVSPGQKITVTLRWKASTVPGGRPWAIEDCVKIGNRISWFSRVHSPAPSGGTDTFTYVVPPGGTGGQPICDRGVLVGPADPQTEAWGQGNGGQWGDSHAQLSESAPRNDGRSQGSDGDQDGDDHDGGRGQDNGWGQDGVQTSAVLCYSILDAATPEAASTILFPLTALLVVGGSVLVVWRRRGRLGAEVPAPGRSDSEIG